MKRPPRLEWLVARFLLALGATAIVLVVVVFPIVAPQFTGGMSEPSVPRVVLGNALWIGGIVGALLGFALMLRIARGSPEAGPSSWRYRRTPRNRLPTLRWIVTRAELALGAIVVLLVIAGPLLATPMRGGLYEPSLRYELLGHAPWIGGIVGAAFGFVWMLRIARRSPEAGPSPWRYRGD